jgi:hypothetical protein
MKKIISVFAMTLLVQLSSGQVNLDSGLVAFYPFLGNANDSSGNNNHGAVTGATLTADRYGNTNSAYYFDGAGNHITVPDDSTLRPAVYTLHAIVKVQGFFQGNCQGNVILWKGRDTWAGHYGLIFSDTPYDSSCFNLDTLHQNFYNDQQHLNPGPDTPYIQKEIWYCLVSTFDGDSVRMWVDGTLRYTAFRNPLGVNFEPVIFGYEPYAVGLEYWFKGIIDEIRIYNRALNNNEVNALCFSQPVQAGFTAENAICPGTCTNFFDLSMNADSYLWSFPGATPDTSTAANPANICYATPGSYDVQLISTNAGGSDTLLITNYITVYPSPLPQSIIQNGDTLFANTGATGYQWYFNGSFIVGATDYFYVAPGSGDYNVVATDSNGCEVEAAIFNVVASIQFEVRGLRFEVFPNPAGEKLGVRSLEFGEAAVGITVYNILGEQLEIPSGKWQITTPIDIGSQQEITIDVSALAKGMYFLEAACGTAIFRVKFIKQ